MKWGSTRCSITMAASALPGMKREERGRGGRAVGEIEGKRKIDG